MKCDEIFAALDMLEKERGISPTFMMDELHVVHGDVHHAAQVHPAVLGPGFVHAHLGAGVLHFLQATPP